MTASAITPASSTVNPSDVVFLTNAVSHERSIGCETGPLLLDAMRHLDELARCLSLLPPRSTVLHRRRDHHLLAQSRLSFAHLRLWRRLDGRASVGEILDENIDGARLLVELIGAGLAAISPDHRFLRELTLVQTVRGAEAATAVIDRRFARTGRACR